MSYEVPFAYDEDESEGRRRWLEDRHHPLLGQHLPWTTVPEWPDVHVIASHRQDRVLPHGFRAYTRYNGDVLTDAGETYDQARWNLQRFVENR